MIEFAIAQEVTRLRNDARVQRHISMRNRQGDVVGHTVDLGGFHRHLSVILTFDDR